MYIGCARSPLEVESAIALAAETFRSNEENTTALETKNFLMSAGKNLSSKDIVVITNNDHNVIGTCFLIDRLFSRMGVQLKGTFLSSICIASSMKGKGLSRLLMNFAITECEDRSSDFAILIARRAVDHFYNKFGFWGISTYSKITFEIGGVSNTQNDTVIECADESHLPSIQEMHTIAYASLNGYCARSLVIWRHILWKAKWHGSSFLVFKVKGKTVGYVIHTGTEVHEIAAIADYQYLELLIVLGKKITARIFTIHASQHHPIIGKLRDLDFSICSRQCLYGGHMVRLISEKKLLEITRQTLISNFREKDQKFIDFNSKSFSIKLNDRGLEFCFLESQFGYESTCALMGASSLSADPRLQSLLNLSPFNVLLFDQV
jgi:predicted acetyltransferase